MVSPAPHEYWQKKSGDFILGANSPCVPLEVLIRDVSINAEAFHCLDRSIIELRTAIKDHFFCPSPIECQDMTAT
jgi:hypothetical protein